MDFHAPPVGSARVTPRDRIVPGDCARRMKEGTVNRRLMTTDVQIDFRHGLLDELRADDFAVDSQMLVDFRPPALRSQ